MDEKKPESAWDELVEELGVETEPAAAERHQPRPTDLPSASQSLDPDSPDSPVSAPKSQPSDWNALAGSLGLEVPPPADSAEEPASSAQKSGPKQDKPPASQPIAREPEVESVEALQDTESELLDELPELRSEFDKELVDATGDSDLEDAVREDAKDSSTGMSGETARDAFDALFAEATSDWELPSNADSILDTPLEFSRSSEEPSVKTPEVDSEIAEEETTERPKRHRSRRRRRGRGGRSAEAEPAEAATEAEDAEPAAPTAEDATVEQGQQESADAEAKPRRRRSRRRGRRSSGETGEGGAEATVERDSPDSPDSLQSGELGLEDEDDESDEQPSSRQLANHRNLPTWAEAIGGIVDANLEQRSKSPNKSTTTRGRGRGGKGRRKKQG